MLSETTVRSLVASSVMLSKEPEATGRIQSGLEGALLLTATPGMATKIDVR